MDIWLSDSEGVSLSSESEHLFWVSDSGNDICNIKTLDEAKGSKFWPLIKEAMKEDNHGKIVSANWEPALRPSTKVLKGRWVPGAKALSSTTTTPHEKLRCVLWAADIVKRRAKTLIQSSPRAATTLCRV